jgi:LuxR family maltose regulon positive regulatory protein
VIARSALVHRLVEARGADLSLLIAPAGYGKSTLLVEWATHDSRPFAWVRLRRTDDDPCELGHSIAAALAAGVPRLRGALDTTGATKRRRSLNAVSQSLGTAIGAAREPFVLVLDNGQALRSRDAFALIESLVESVRGHSQIVLSSRQQPPLPAARLRTERRLFELGTGDLTLTRQEVGSVAAGAGLHLEGGARDLLAQRTEGWPVGVYMAALALRDETAPEQALESFGGDDRLVVEYIRDELLAELPGPLIEFLARSSVLPRLSGPLCDHVLERSDSARLLRKLSRINLPIVPLDRTDTEYRYNALLSESLRGELRLREPELEPQLHARASEWYEQHGERGMAIEHALQASDVERAGALVWDATPEMLGYGQAELLARWLGNFSRDRIAGCVPLALSSASAELAVGDRALAEHWLAAAEQAAGGNAEKSGGAGLHVLRAAILGGDLTIVRSEAGRAYELAGSDNQWRSLACLFEGMALRLMGDHETARDRLEEGARCGVAAAPAVQVLCLGQLALLAIDQGDWDGAAARAAIARAQIERVGLEEFPLAALVYAASAAVNGHMSRPEASERETHHADRLLEQLTGFIPWYTAQCRIALAWASVRLSEITRARDLLADAARDLREHPEATAAHASLRACRELVEIASAARADDAEELTTAELRVLQFLPTHLSFPEIADELYVSRNTVKTHVRAVYRKLTASSRSEAVDHARQAGLLDRLAA